MNTILHTNKILAVDPASGIECFKATGLYKLVSYEVLCSIIIKIFNVNTAFFAHTIMPIFFIPFHYILVYMIGKAINKKTSHIFVLIYEMINLYSGYSGYSQGAFLLYRIWQGKAVMINIIMLVLIYEFIECYKIDKLGKCQIAFMSFILLAGLHSTTVALYLVPIAYFCLVTGYLVTTVKWQNTLKLCIPILSILPFVILKAKILLFSNAENGIAIVKSIATEEKVSYSIELIDKFLNGYSGMLLIYAIALVCILIIGNRIEKGILVMPTVILFITFLNPLFAEVISEKITGVSVYWRLFWLLEIPLVIGVAISSIAGKCREENVVIIACIGMLLVSINGEYILNFSGFEHRTNKYKLDARAVQIADSINMDANNKEVRLLLPVELSYGIREYCGNIELLLNRYTDSTFEEAGKTSELKELYNDLVNPLYIEKKWDAEEIEGRLKDFSVNYVVILKEMSKQNIVGKDMKLIYENSEYTIYKCTN